MIVMVNKKKDSCMVIALDMHLVPVVRIGLDCEGVFDRFSQFRQFDTLGGRVHAREVSEGCDDRTGRTRFSEPLWPAAQLQFG